MNEEQNDAPTSRNGRRMSPTAKSIVEFGPLAVFFIVYFFSARLAPFLSGLFGSDWKVEDGQELFLAIAAFMPLFAVGFAYSIWIERRLAPMLIVSFVVVGVLGSLTLIFQDRTFFYMKPTIAYALFAATLGGGLVAGRNLLRTAFDGALQLPEDVWRTLTIRYTVFFAVLAVSNEIAWRWLMAGCDINAGPKCPGEPTWVNLKLFGFTILNVVFAAAQGPLIGKYLSDEPQNGD